MATGPKPKVVAAKEIAAIQGYCGLVWELIDRKNTDAQRLNLAQVNIDEGRAAQLHLHRQTEEIYFILEGQGEVTIGENAYSVSQGYAVLIPPGCVHTIKNSGRTTLQLLAINSPPYDPADTFFP
ncbi:cupin domain-containing protein [Dehalococcoidia bacterium]|nr:cupin domain-containing protein [Dehalococcoidia bacterium]MCL0088798.1 cupin domain-containing protein [Dehalococcoidia bacterium]MCL0092339.1 cupin domain-containing protein [Dehalococcoidia bacterium]